PKTFNRYIEPFLGAGSVFFHLHPQSAILGDINPDVIAAYKGIKDNWKGVKRSLQYHQRMHSEEHYYCVRSQKSRGILRQASRMIYLNRTCFNGIYRVNLRGEFNVPIGSKNKVIFENDEFENISHLLQSATIKCTDFEEIVDLALKDDLVFIDPPYTVRHN